MSSTKFTHFGKPNRTLVSPWIHFILIRINYLLLVNLGTSTRKLSRRLFYPVHHSVFLARLWENEAQALEISETQAKNIKSSGNAAKAVLPTLSQAKKNCFNCGGIVAMSEACLAWRTMHCALSVIMQTLLLPWVTTHKGIRFKWQEVHQKALEQLKWGLTSDKVMAYFDPQKKTVLFVDASPVGLGAMLTQSGKVIYASKALSSVERHYSQIGQEAAAITWGCHHFHMYLLGSPFEVMTDHKPLLGTSSPVLLPKLRQGLTTSVIWFRSSVLKRWFQSSWLHIKTPSCCHAVWLDFWVWRAVC